ncbi:putative surface protein with fasciclin (FAS1) repeats [Actinocorallia herbida]|uniref:Putative surface protein with fasciclin (FAS1) repeats n=1 Tax=Actinocorallia herbida TaxID=58109 RepID=A0A3N1DB78_9ACTN|nr:fasciclin domain-containing protein [Actinocorallia herbida]ROO90787.1 putative surface protein with fasciclin (FAS1) repeats [Actinocorallia herbida]
MKGYVLAAGAVMVMGVAGCGGATQDAAGKGGKAATSQAPAAVSVSAAAPQTFGSGCAAVQGSAGAGLAGMAAQPVVTALADSPELTSFASAVRKAGMVDTLDTAPEITVFAPSNAAWAAVKKSDLDDGMILTGILMNLIVEGRQGPAELGSGDLETLRGSSLKVAGSDGAYTVGGARILCGNISTGNATVHVIDKVLLPPEE